MSTILQKGHPNAVFAISDEISQDLRYSCKVTMLVYFQGHSSLDN